MTTAAHSLCMLIGLIVVAFVVVVLVLAALIRKDSKWNTPL